MESRAQRIEKIRKETDEEVREAMEGSASLVPEVNPETLEPEEEEEDLTIRIYEAVAKEYRELYQSFDLENYFKSEEGKEVLEKVREYVNYHLAKGKKDPNNASWAIRSLSAIISTPELKKLFTEEEINGWLVQAADDGFKAKVRERVGSNLANGKTNSDYAYWAIQTLSAIHRLPEALSSEANRLRAEEYDKGKKKPLISSPRLPFEALAK